jgi:NADH dehydrogenase (ubiquinone) 1 alpha subcomplex subunit 9
MALQKMLYDDATASQTYELYGPTNYSLAEIAEMVDKEIIKRRRHVNLPKAILKPTAEVLNKLLWWPISSGDEVEREFIDQVIDPSAKTFADLDIEPAEIQSLTYNYLVGIHLRSASDILLTLRSLQVGYRSSAFSDLPPATEREKREEKKYLHVLDDQ